MKAVIIGNSDGIGLATTKTLLEQGWQLCGLSRSPSPIDHANYNHVVKDIGDSDYLETLTTILENSGPFSRCLFCVGIGELLDTDNMDQEVHIVDINLMGLIKTTSLVIPHFLKQGGGHFVGLSSLADELLSPEAPSYNAAKAGFSNYLESLALALRPKGIQVTNVRFGFVDTKMAKGDQRPLMMSLDKAVGHLMKCLKHKPIRYTAPRLAMPLVKLISWATQLRLLFS